jgi:hypothetical protein
MNSGLSKPRASESVTDSEGSRVRPSLRVEFSAGHDELAD